MATNFRALLAQKTNEVERPKTTPKGHFCATLINHEFGQSKRKQTPFVRFNCQLTSALSDVDPVALEGIDLSERKMWQDFYITPGSLFRLTDMLNRVLGYEEGRQFDERIPDCDGMDVVVLVIHEQSEDGTETYAKIKTIMSASAAGDDEMEAEAA